MCRYDTTCTGYEVTWLDEGSDPMVQNSSSRDLGSGTETP